MARLASPAWEEWQLAVRCKRRRATEGGPPCRSLPANTIYLFRTALQLLEVPEADFALMLAK